jgi:SSS family solute:Na+ symporter
MLYEGALALSFTEIDWLILLIYIVTVLGIAVALRQSITTSGDFLQAGRSLPAWICGLAFISVSMGAPEVIGMGAWGARYGFESAQLFGIGAIPAMLFTGLYMMPLYYSSKARSVPEFLRLRFDEKTRALSACLFVLTTVFISGISLYAMARLIQALHVFDSIFYSLGHQPKGTFAISIILLAAVVTVYVLLSGLAGAMYNQVLQFFVLVAGLLPMVLLGLKNIGGWSGLKSSVGAADPGLLHEWMGVMQAGGNPLGIDALGLTIGLGFVLGFGYWCTNFVVIQTAMAAKDAESARRAPLIAAIPTMILPFLLILPGLIAMGLPTPHSTTTTHTDNGTIFRETTVVPQQVERGDGLVPAQVDPTTGRLVLDSNGKPLLDYEMVTPSMLMHFLPTGVLGLGLTALLASFMSGMAGNATAFNTVFTCDLYESYLHRGASDRHYLVVARLATVGAIVLSVGTAFAVMNLSGVVETMLLVFSVVLAPLLATILLGMFWKRATGHGAFAGMIAGTVAAIVHHGMTLPADAHAGIHGGWIAVLHPYPNAIAQGLYGSVIACSTGFIVTIGLSLLTRARPETELAGLVHSLTPKSPMRNRSGGSGRRRWQSRSW